MIVQIFKNDCFEKLFFSTLSNFFEIYASYIDDNLAENTTLASVNVMKWFYFGKRQKSVTRKMFSLIRDGENTVLFTILTNAYKSVRSEVFLIYPQYSSVVFPLIPAICLPKNTRQVTVQGAWFLGHAHVPYALTTTKNTISKTRLRDTSAIHNDFLKTVECIRPKNELNNVRLHPNT